MAKLRQGCYGTDFNFITIWRMTEKPRFTQGLQEFLLLAD